MTGDTKSRQKAYLLGHRAELFARWFLRLKGYRIVDHRFKVKQGEIDIIARKKNLIAMIEVKGRKSVQEAVDAVGWQTQKRIKDAADIWLAKQHDAHLLSVRFDIVAIVPRKLPHHFEDAF